MWKVTAVIASTLEEIEMFFKTREEAYTQYFRFASSPTYSSYACISPIMKSN